MIRHENNQIVLNGKTAEHFSHKMKSPKSETLVKRDRYFKQIESNLSVRHVNGKIIIK